jgi:hypothetical protein
VLVRQGPDGPLATQARQRTIHFSRFSPFKGVWDPSQPRASESRSLVPDGTSLGRSHTKPGFLLKFQIPIRDLERQGLRGAWSRGG